LLQDNDQAKVDPMTKANLEMGRDVFIAPTAVVLGSVAIGDESSVWFGAVLRGDVGSIRIGARTNVQDLCVLHMTGGISQTDLGDEVTVGHGVILHGCRIGHRSLLGIGSILLDNVEVGEESLIAAGSLVTPRTKIPPRSFVLGRPARVVRSTTDEEVARQRESALHYVELARTYR
jgi:carbonic anhydrase/acetyltransferase-like protein (isoleucine patch superfamily)